MSDWATAVLGDYVELLLGFAFKSKGFSLTQLGPRLVRGDNVKRGVLEWGATTRYWPDPDPDLAERYSLQSGDVVIGMDGSRVGENYAVLTANDLPALLVQRVACVRAGVNMDQGFLRYLVCNPDFTSYVKAIHTGTSIPHISGAQIAAYPVIVPPLAEQCAIAEVLGALDDKIEANRCVIGAANAVLDAIFWAHAVDSESTTASEVVDPILGGTPSRANPDYWSGSIPWASAKDVAAASDGVLLGTAESISERGLAESPAKLVGEGVSIITARGTVGRLVRTALPSTSFNQTCYALVPRGDVPPLLLYLGMKRALDRLSGLTHGTIFPTITKQTFDVLPINLPADDEWRRLSAQLESTDRLVIALLVENERLTRIRDALLPKLMSGELRVRDAERLVEDAV